MYVRIIYPWQWAAALSVSDDPTYYIYCAAEGSGNFFRTLGLSNEADDCLCVYKQSKKYSSFNRQSWSTIYIVTGIKIVLNLHLIIL